MQKKSLDGLCAELAAGGREGHVTEALRAGFGGHGIGAFHPCKHGVGRCDDQVVDHACEEQEGDRRVEEVAVHDVTAIDVKCEGGEVRFADYRCDEGGNDVFNE